MSICWFNCSDLKIGISCWGSLLVGEALLSNNVLTSLGGIEVNWQFNSLGLVDSEGQIRFFLQVFESKSFQVLFSEGLRVKDTCWGYL